MSWIPNGTSDEVEVLIVMGQDYFGGLSINQEMVVYIGGAVGDKI